MKERMTQILFATALVLLLMHFYRAAPTAQAAAIEQVPAVLRARMIELVDERGQVRANLQVEQSGEAVFRMRDAKGTIRVKLNANEDGSGFLLLDDRTEPAVHMLAQRSGTIVTLAEKDKEKKILKP